MSTFKERLELAMSNRRGVTAADLARACGIKPPSVSDWFSGKTKSLKSDNLLAVSAFLNVDPQWLNTGRPASAAPSGQSLSVRETRAIFDVSRDETRPGYVRFHLLDAVAGAGGGIVNDDFPEVLEEIEIAEWQVRQQFGRMLSPAHVKLLTARGESMLPMIRSGDVMFIDTQVTGYDGDGIYIINVNGETLVKQLFMTPEGIVVRSLNAAFPPWVVPPKDRDTLHVGGRMLGTVQVRKSDDLWA